MNNDTKPFLLETFLSEARERGRLRKQRREEGLPPKTLEELEADWSEIMCRFEGTVYEDK